jgi:hypothetical protein
LQQADSYGPLLGIHPICLISHIPDAQHLLKITTLQVAQ